MNKRIPFRLSFAAASALVSAYFFLPVLTVAEPSACSILSPAQVSSILGTRVDSGIAITRSNPAAPGAIGHACAYVGGTRSAVLGLYRGSKAQLLHIKEINERTGSVTAMRSAMLVSAVVTSGAHTPDRATAKKLLDAALSKL